MPTAFYVVKDKVSPKLLQQRTYRSLIPKSILQNRILQNRLMLSLWQLRPCIIILAFSGGIL